MTKVYSGAQARRLLAELTLDLERLEEVSPRTFAAYEQSWEKVAVVGRLFTRLISHAIDINLFVLVTNGVQPPTSYFQTFQGLVRLKVLPTKLAHDLARGTAVRNRLEHEYDRIDHAQVYAYINKVPRWYSGYVRHISRWLDSQENPDKPKRVPELNKTRREFPPRVLSITLRNLLVPGLCPCRHEINIRRFELAVP